MEYENKFVDLNPIDSDSTNNYSITIEDSKEPANKGFG